MLVRRDRDALREPTETSAKLCGVAEFCKRIGPLGMAWVVGAALVIVVLAGLALLVLNAVWDASAPTDIFVARCSFDGLLGYAGTVFGAVATTALAVASVWQTRQAYKGEERRERENTKRPFLVVRSVECDGRAVTPTGTGAIECEATEESPCIRIALKNVGDGPANNYKWEVDGFGASRDPFEEHSCIPANEGAVHSVRIPVNGSSGEIIKAIDYENMLGCRYRQVLRIKYEAYPIYGAEPANIETPGGIEVACEAIGCCSQVSVFPLGAQEVVGGRR